MLSRQVKNAGPKLKRQCITRKEGYKWMMRFHMREQKKGKLLNGISENQKKEKSG
jgi:hypothetical protein